MYNEDLQIEKLKEMKGENKIKRKPPKKTEKQLFDKNKNHTKDINNSKGIKSNKKLNKKVKKKKSY
tara:strand:+ start:123 stop:320 length:198 start_codon:yes stop_codon:yes gene_type:complete